MIDKKAVPTKLFWVDLEMTGLDVQNDVILEVAAEITDFDFNTLASYQARVTQPKEVVAARMQKNTWWNEYPENRDNFLENLDTGKPNQQVEAELVQLLAEHFGDEPAVLAGNSIHNDRNFIKQWWPTLDSAMHYRMLDVSSLKVYMQGKHGIVYEKPEVHRAYEDIRASIAEFQSYLGQLKQL